MSYIKSRKHAAAPHALAALAASLSLPLAAQAQQSAAAADQDEQQMLPVVKVNGQREVPFKADISASTKLTQPLLETPKTIQIIKKEVLQEQGAATLMEALRNTPGITMQLGENGNTSAGDTFQMRGFSAQTSTFVDGIRDLGTTTRDVFNLEQVEVIKGPAGSDTGRGGSAGYINLISKLPTLDAFTDAALTLGTADRKRATADYNGRLGESTAIRLNAMAQNGGVDGRDVVKNKGWAIAPAIATGLGTPTRLFLYSQHLRQDNIPDGGIPTVGMEGFYNANATIQAAPQADRANYYGSRKDHEKVDGDMVSAKLEMDLGGGSVVRNLSRYGKSHMQRVLPGVNAPAVNASSGAIEVARTRQRVDQTNEIIADQTSIVTSFQTAGLRHELSAGLELMYERQQNLGTTNGSSSTVNVVLNGKPVPGIAIPPANLHSPNANDVMGTPLLTGADVDGKTSTAALYALDTINLSDALELSAGLRFEHYDTTTNSGTLVTGGSGGNSATYAPLGYGVGSIAHASLRDADHLSSWNIGLLYKLQPNGSVYAAAADSLTPPGGNNFQLSGTATNQAHAALDPQETTNYEIGSKWELLDKRLNVTAALYRSENDKQVTQDPVTQTFIQTGKTRVEGIELAAVGQLTNFWQLSAGIAKMKTKQLGQVSVASGTGAVTTTEAVRWSPDLSASVWTSYTLGSFTLGGGVRYVSEQKRTITGNTNLATQNMPLIPSYVVADLMAAYRISPTINLQLNITNLFDEDYIGTLNNGGSRAVLGAPRGALLTASMQF